MVFQFLLSLHGLYFPETRMNIKIIFQHSAVIYIVFIYGYLVFYFSVMFKPLGGHI